MTNSSLPVYPIIPDKYIRMIATSSFAITKCNLLNANKLAILLKSAIDSSRKCGTLCFHMGHLKFTVKCYSKFENEMSLGEFDCYYISAFCDLTNIEVIYTWDKQNALSIYDEEFVKYTK